MDGGRITSTLRRGTPWTTCLHSAGPTYVDSHRLFHVISVFVKQSCGYKPWPCQAAPEPVVLPLCALPPYPPPGTHRSLMDGWYRSRPNPVGKHTEKPSVLNGRRVSAAPSFPLTNPRSLVKHFGAKKLKCAHN